MSRRSRVFAFDPVGLDLYDRKPHHPKPGTRVVKIQPPGCPRNGTMGMCYVQDADTGAFYGLVLLNSLVGTREYVVPRNRAEEAREARTRAFRERRSV